MEEIIALEKNDYLADNISMDSVIEDIIKRHSISKVEINNLTLECMTALTASNAKSYELGSKSKLKYIIDSFNGKNKKLISDMNISLATSQEAAQLTLQKLAESNLMSFELISAVNFKLNNTIKYVNNEVKDIYTSMISLFKTAQSEIWEINTRLDKIERNLDLLNWLGSLEYRVFRGQEYSELSLNHKILVVTRDFYNIVGNEVKPSDLLSLKSSLKSINVNPNEEVQLFDFLNDISTDPDLIELLNGNKIINNANYLPIASYLSNLSSFQTDKRYIIEHVITELNSHNVYQEPEVLIQNLSKRYVNDYLQYDLTSNIKIFDLILLILLHLEQTKQTTMEVIELSEIELIEEESTGVIENNDLSLLKVWDMININKIFEETEKYYYYYEGKNLFRINKTSHSKEQIFSIQEHERSFFGFIDNWNIRLLRDNYIVYRKDSAGGRYDDYVLCLYSIEQQSEKLIYRSVRRFSFGVDNETNTVYYFTNGDDEFSKNKMIKSGLFKYDVSKGIHKQVVQISTNLNNAFAHLHSEDLARDRAFYPPYDHHFTSSPISCDMFISVHQGKVLIEPIYTSLKEWSVLIKDNGYTFYTLPEEMKYVIDKKKKYRKLGISGDSYNFNLNFNWDKEIYEVDFSSFEWNWTKHDFPIEVTNESSTFQVLIAEEGISKYILKKEDTDFVYPMNVSDYMRKTGYEIGVADFKRSFPTAMETLILGRFETLNVLGTYLYTRNLTDNRKIYRYNLNNLDDIEIIE